MSTTSRMRHVTAGGTGLTCRVVTPSAMPLATIVWLHGLGGAATVQFAGLADRPELADVTSVLVDLPGFGLSAGSGGPYTIDAYARVVNEVVRQVTDAPVILFGHSMGGTVAILAARDDPDAVSRLVVAEPNLAPGSGPLSSRIAAMTGPEWRARGYPALLRTTRIAARTDPEAAGFLATLRMASPAAMHEAAASLCEPRDPSPGEILASLDIPRTAIVGARSRWPHEVPGVPVLTVANAGHDMMAANPDGFVAALLAAIDPLVPPRTC